MPHDQLCDRQDDVQRDRDRRDSLRQLDFAVVLIVQSGDQIWIVHSPPSDARQPAARTGCPVRRRITGFYLEWSDSTRGEEDQRGRVEDLSLIHI